MLASTAGAYSNKALYLTHKHQPKLERPAGVKQSSLLGTFASYGRKSFFLTQNFSWL
jgi:hypothetical protein